MNGTNERKLEASSRSEVAARVKLGAEAASRLGKTAIFEVDHHFFASDLLATSLSTQHQLIQQLDRLPVMGLFSSSSKPEVTPQAGSSSSLPTRSSRQACWSNRDAYYTCLTSHNVIIPPGTDMSDGRGPPIFSPASVEKLRREDPCKAERDGFERDCAKSWVDYFNKRRVLEERQRLMLEKSGQIQQK